MIWAFKLSFDRSLLLLLALVALAGCSSKQSLMPVPTPLLAIEAVFTSTPAWRSRVKLADDKAHGLAQHAAITAASIYISDGEGVVHSLSVTQGQPQWQVMTGLSLSSGIGFGKMAVDQGLVLVASHDGDVLAIGADDGQIRWRSQVSSEVLTAPVISDGVVIVRSIDGKLVVLDITDGRRLWSYQVQPPSLSLHGISAPLVYQGRIIIGQGDGRVVALAQEDGRVLWQTTVAVAQGRSELERLVDVDANMAQLGHVLYAAAFQGRVVAIDMRTGRLLWARDLSVYRGLAVDEDALYVVDDEDALWALSRRNGATLWKQKGLMARGLTAPLRVDEHVVVADSKGYVHWLSRRDGGFVARTAVAKKAITVLQKDDDDALYTVSLDGWLTKLLMK